MLERQEYPVSFSRLMSESELQDFVDRFSQYLDD
jgi:hypothetical protein